MPTLEVFDFIPQLSVQTSEVLRYYRIDFLTIKELVPSGYLAIQSKQDRDVVPVHLLPSAPAIKKEPPTNVQLKESLIKIPNYGVNIAACHRMKQSVGI